MKDCTLLNFNHKMKKICSSSKSNIMYHKCQCQLASMLARGLSLMTNLFKKKYKKIKDFKALITQIKGFQNYTKMSQNL